MGTCLSPSSQVNPALRQRWLSSSSVLTNKPSHILLSSPHDIFSVAENYSWQVAIDLFTLFWSNYIEMGNNASRKERNNGVEHKDPSKTERGGQSAPPRSWPNSLPLELQLIISWKSLRDRPKRGCLALGLLRPPPTEDAQTPKYQKGLCGPKSESENQNVIIPQT